MLTWAQVWSLAERLAEQLSRDVVWGVPRGGAVVAGMLTQFGVEVTDDPKAATVAVDDLIDSGRTRDRVRADHGLDTKPLVTDKGDEWVVFPWEGTASADAEELVARMIEYVGDSPARAGMIETPARVVRSWSHLFGGYSVDVPALLKWFPDEADQMVTLRGVQFYSTCEHHGLPFYGTVDIGYIPNGAVVGVSKMARVVDAVSRRYQIQERMTREIGEAMLQTATHQPLGVAVRVRGQHMCMMARGVAQQSATMETTYLTGAFRTEAAARHEFLG